MELGLGLSRVRFLRFVRSARFLRGARRGPARPYLLAFSAHHLRPSSPPSRTQVLSCARRARPPPRWRQERLFNTLRWRCAAPAVHCGTRPRKVSRPQFRRTQRASGLRPSRRSLPRGLHGPDRELDRYATRSASAGGCRKSGWLTAASRRLPDRRVQNVWSVTVYVRSVLITSTVDPSKRYTRSYLAGGLARSSVCRHTGRAALQEELDGE